MGPGFSSCCHVNQEISSSLCARGPSFAEQPGEQENSRKIFHTPGLSFESVTKLKAGQVSPGFVTGLFAQIYYSLHYIFSFLSKPNH